MITYDFGVLVMDDKYCHSQKRRLMFIVLLLIFFSAIFPNLARAACSSYVGKVTINEYNYINNYIELKVLDSPLTAGGANPFAGWKLTVWKKSGGSMTKAQEEDVSSNYTDSAKNTCRTTNYSYVKIPIPGADMTSNTIVVLWNSNTGTRGEIIDLFRLGQSSLAAYPSSINSGYSQYDQCTTIEALPDSHYDAPLVGSAGNKDIARLPDGTGLWTISNGTGSNSQESPCTTNNALFAITKTPSSASVGIGAGNTFIWTITVTNGGTVGDLSDTTIKDTLPTNMFLSSCPTGATCTGSAGAYTYFEKNVGQLTPGLSATISATAYVTATGTYSNTATATATELNPGYTQSTGIVTASPSLDHVRLNHTGSGVTCTGSSVTVNACNSVDSSGTCTANTIGLTGNVIAKSAGGATLVTVPFIIAAGSSSTTVTVPVTSAQTITFETSGLSITPSSTWSCWNGSTASCSHVYNDSGLIFDVPNHVSEVLQTVNVSAVKKSDNNLLCIPAFANVPKSVTFKCAYSNPTTGTLPARVNGNAMNATNNLTAACDVGGRAVSLSFNGSGVASTTFQYADVGNMALTATYTGSGSDAGLTMTGSDSFIAKPDYFDLSIPSNPAAIDATGGIFVKAGSPFSVTVTAKNAANNATPNFGKETSAEGVKLTHNLILPSGGATGVLSSGTIAGTSFNNGAATVNNLAWSEVGIITLTPSVADGDYLGVGDVTGTTSTNIGRFYPDHFAVTGSINNRKDLVCTPASTFTYMDEPLQLALTLTAQNTSNGVTQNYTTANGFAKLDATDPWLTLGSNRSFGTGAIDVTTTAPLSPRLLLDNIPSGTWNAGINNLTANFKLSKPTSTTPDSTWGAYENVKLGVAPQDADGVSASVFTLDADNNGSNERVVVGNSKFRYGRVALQNAYGSELLALGMPLTAQYWNGNSWITNTSDSCTDTTLSFTAVGADITNKTCVIESSAANNSGKGCVGTPTNYQFLEAGLTGTDSNGTAGFAGNFNLWLKATGAGNTGSLDVTATVSNYLKFNWRGAGDTNPIARATFGIYKGNDKVIYFRELY